MRAFLLAGLLLIGALLSGSHGPAVGEEKTPPNVEALINLLADPGVQKWLNEHKAPQPAAAAASPQHTEPGLFLSTALADIRAHVRRVAAALPGLPDEFARARERLSAEEARLGPFGPLELIALSTALSALLGWLYRRATAPVGDRLAGAAPATVRERLLTIAGLFALDAGTALAIAVGCVTALLALEWPLLPKDLVLVALLAWASFSLARAVLRAALSPPGARKVADPEALRLLPVGNERAAFWYGRLGAAAAWFIFGYALVLSLSLLGFSIEGRQLVAYGLGLGLLALGVAMAWASRRTAEASVRRRIGPTVAAASLSLSFALLWLFWAAGAMKLFWLVAVALLLPFTIRLSRRTVAHALRPVAPAEEPASLPSIAAVCVDRGIRVALIVGSVMLLAWAWGIDLVDLTASDTLATRMLRGIMSAVVILLVADFTWQIARTLVDLNIASVQELGEPGTPDAHRRARLRTLLPIFRNMLFAVLAVVAVLMALASLGVEIGPLVAGAGVVGVAIGFGAQTLVKDIISGMFYLLDDAFRVGEYIESGKFKGTVESFSLRSVKLRHQRGPIFTVPFGELGAVQNMSRDWVVEKIMLNITYDSDVEKARKIIKKIGLELAEDPEFKNSTIDPLKMQGVDNFGDYAIQIRLKLKTKPGEQFNIKRRAFMMIKQAFEENGIKFARPIVQVASGAPPDAAAAAAMHEAMEKQKRDLAAAS